MDQNCTNCQCPRRVHRFIEPCLLLSLRRRPSYGYQLLDDLAAFGFHPYAPDTAALYRNLHRLEREGYVHSVWKRGESGPAKRYYNLTAQGCRLLAEWAEAMESQAQALHQFLAEYKQNNGQCPLDGSNS